LPSKTTGWNRHLDVLEYAVRAMGSVGSVTFHFPIMISTSGIDKSVRGEREYLLKDGRKGRRNK
jgi:hypothetical protein